VGGTELPSTIELGPVLGEGGSGGKGNQEKQGSHVGLRQDSRFEYPVVIFCAGLSRESRQKQAGSENCNFRRYSQLPTPMIKKQLTSFNRNRRPPAEHPKEWAARPERENSLT
jgi:hypothetical protein